MHYAVTIDSTGRRLTQKHLEQLLAEPIGGVVAGALGDTEVSVTMTIDAADPVAALAEAIEKVRQVRGNPHVDAAEVLTATEQDRRLALPAFPELVGVSEIAEMFGVSRQRASRLQSRSDFPAPVATLAAGPVWRRGDLSTFADQWERAPGRPKTNRAEIDASLARIAEGDLASASRKRQPARS